jgi:hypothetical protein
MIFLQKTAGKRKKDSNAVFLLPAGTGKVRIA